MGWSEIAQITRGNSSFRPRLQISLRRIETSLGASNPSCTTLPFILSTVTVIPPSIIAPTQAADKAKSPNQILGGKPAASAQGSGSSYNGSGSYSGRTSSTGQSTSIYNGQGSYDGRIDRSKNDARTYDGKGSYRTGTNGKDTKKQVARDLLSRRGTSSSRPSGDVSSSECTA